MLGLLGENSLSMGAESGGELAVRPFEALPILPDVKIAHNN